MRVKSLLLVVLLGASAASAAPLPGGTLNPLTIPKYVQPLVVPPPMPEVVDPLTGLAVPNTYDVAVRQFFQQVLPPGLPLTKVWGYGATNAPASFNYPAFTILASQGTPTTVTWRNELIADPVACNAIVDPLLRAVDPACNYLPHFLPIDQTLHWANPPMDCRVGEVGPDCRGNSPLQYTGPVPIVTHLHGGHIDPMVDGYPEAWFLPNANNIPVGYATAGSNYPANLGWAPGTAVYTYRNDQRGTTLWYHDHALGITRNNVQTGMAGFYFLRDAYEQDLIAGTNTTGFNASLTVIPSGAQEIPLAIQDRSFNADGSIFFPGSRVFFDGFAGPYFPTTDVPPTWNPEYFGNTMVVNGRTWPFHQVQARRYRLRLLNGTDSRFLILQLVDGKGANAPAFSIIGNDGGFLPRKPVTVAQVVIGPGERYDTIVDFGPFAGRQVFLKNFGPDSPWGGGAVPGALRSDPNTTGQVMRFDVLPRPVGFVDPVPPAGQIVLNQPPDPFGGPAATGAVRTLTLNEIVTALPFGGPIEAQLGDWSAPLPWRAPITEDPLLNSTEVWNIVNRTVDAHPIHLHQVQFVVMDRTPIDLAAWDAAVAACLAAPGTCPATGPDPFLFVKKGVLPVPAALYEAGAKDTLLTRPGEITRVRAFFDIPGLYVWHCHILSHEDNEMMRPYCVGGGCLK